MALTRIKTDQITDGQVKGGDIDSSTTLILGSINAAAVDLSGNMTLLGEIRGPATFVIDPAAVGDNTGTVVIKGNLQVDGLTTTINSTTMSVDDKNIVLADGSANAAAADGAGITVAGASATLLYSSTYDSWAFNKNLGIGTAAPAVRLHASSGAVDEVARFEGTGSPYFSIYRSGTRQFYLYNTSASTDLVVEPALPLRFLTTGAVRMTLDATGNLSISQTTASTTTTTGALTVAGGVGIAGALNVGGETSKFGSGVSLVSISNGGGYGSVGSAAGLALYSEGAQQAVVYTNLIAYHNYRLQVQDTTASTSTTTGSITAAGGVGIAGNLHVGGATTASVGSIQVTSIDAALRLKWTSSPVANKNTWDIRSVGTGTTPYLQFRTINDANTVFTDRVAFTNDGNVGIGTTTPGERLDVAGSIRLTSNTADLNYTATIAARYDSANPFTLKVKNNGSESEYIGVYANSGGGGERLVFPGIVGVSTTTIGSGSARLEVRKPSAFTYSTIPYQATTAAILSPVMEAPSTDTYQSILQLVSVRRALVSGRYAHGYLGFSTVDNSNATGILDAGRISIKNDEGIGTVSPTSLGFWTNAGGSASNAATEHMRLSSGGKLGLGQLAPVAKLHIGAETEVNLSQQSLFVQGSKVGYASIPGLPQNQLLIYDDTVSTAGSGGAIGFGANTGASQRTWIAAIESRRDSATNDATNYAGSLVFYTRPAQSPPEERLRITSAGNVGIGTITPNARLEVATAENKNQNASAVALFRTSTQGSSDFELILSRGTNSYYSLQAVEQNVSYRNIVLQKDGGGVGIGTTNPTKQLEVKGTTTGSAIRASTTDGAGSASFGYGFYVDNRQHEIAQILANYVSSGNAGYGGLKLNVANNGLFTAMTLGYTGNVGIGTEDPTTKLHVKGSATNGAPFINFETVSANGGFNWVSTAFASNLAASNNLIHFIGQAGSAKNSAYIGYKHSSAGSNSNILTLGLFGVDNILNINGLGNVGIGTQEPGEKLEVVGNIAMVGQAASGAETNRLQFYNIGAGKYQIASIRAVVGAGQVNRGELGFYVNNGAAEQLAMYINYTQDITFGNSAVGTNRNFYLDGALNKATRFIFREAGVERWLIGHGAASENANFEIYSATGNNFVFTRSGNFAIAGTFTESSTIRVKENVRPITGALDKVCALNGIIYDKKDGTAKDEPGLIAEDVYDVIKDLVVLDDEGKPAAIKYTKTVAYLVEAIKELKAEIDLLKASR